MTDQDETMTAKQLARKLNTDPKTLRKFLRSKDSPVEAVGQGGRYEFDADASKLIIDGFKNWGGVKTTKLKSEVADEEIEETEEPTPAPKRSRRKKETEAPVAAVDDAIEELEDDSEPSAEELEELEDLDDLFEELDD